MAKRLPPEDVWSFVHRYYEREMGERLPLEHSATIVVVVAAMQEYIRTRRDEICDD